MLWRLGWPLALALGATTAVRAEVAPCQEPADVRIWWSPEVPAAGEPVKLLAVSEAPLEGGTLVMAERSGAVEPLATFARGGPPWSLAAQISAAPAGALRIELRRGDRRVACRSIAVGRGQVQGRGRGQVQVKGKDGSQRREVGPTFWATKRPWDRATENFFSAWVEVLFDAPPGESLSFRPLAPALRDPSRNFLWGYLRLGEDDPRNRQALPASPDCADLPYYLRAYFAWKLGLPFGFRDCDRGTSSATPRCGALFTNEEPAEGKSALLVFRQFLRKLANTVHSGSARTAIGDEASDFYPVPLTREALRPGMIYADPYGHVLVVVKWVPQSGTRGGLLLAVDGQPDGSIGRKRFWEGTFLFATGVPSAGPGFKAFRPLDKSGEAALAPLSNQALEKDKSGRFAPISREQEKMSQEAFYARMGKLINPQGLDPRAAYEETLSALVEQLEARVGSVDNGEKYMRETRDAVVAMPQGPKIFETVGPWEDYATPSRDMRLIIAMNVLLALPQRIVRHPALYVLGGRKPEEVRKEIEALHGRLTGERSIEYRRTDGTPWKLTIAAILGRKTALEMAYNPNDCAEIRWGAARGTPEYAPCKRRAPEDQRRRMEEYRAWFREARRPPR
jgi:hypothetical protein